jgi:hypothetical protein
MVGELEEGEECRGSEKGSLMGRKYLENTGVDGRKIKIDIQEKWCKGENVLSVLFKDTFICQVYRISAIGE